MIERSILNDRFELLELIDQGGVGAVYRGRDLKTGQAIAVKVLKPEIITLEPTLIDRFKREAEALRQLNHPNIVQSIASVEHDGHYYIVMEYVPGGSLEKLLKAEKQLTVERTLQIALDISDALTRAHRLKIIHRDIKPANVLLAADGSPRLTDFGVAQVGDSRTKLTEIGAFVGTIAYLSPEVARGDAYDERSDIWAFGVMMYEMLSGFNPFIEGNVALTLSAILNKVPPDLTDSRPDVPPELAYLIDRMIAKDRQDRISSIRSVGAELETILAQVNRAKRHVITDTVEVSAPAPTNAPALSEAPAKSTDLPAAESFTEPPTEPARGDLIEDETQTSPKTIKMDVQPQAKQKAARASDSKPEAVPPAPAPTPPPSDSSRGRAPSSPNSPMGRMIVDDQLIENSPLLRRRISDPRVFIAYRREDAGDLARKIYDIFHRELGDTDVARDVDRVANRTINRVVLAQDIVASFDAMVVVIGRQFIGLQGQTTSGKPQTLFNPKDHLRIQLEAGLRREDMLIIPVLVDGAPLPAPEELPPSLQKIVTKPPFTLDWKPEQGDAVLEAQIKKLIKQIRATLNPMERRWLVPAVVLVVTILVLIVIIVLTNGQNTPGLIAPLLGLL